MSGMRGMSRAVWMGGLCDVVRPVVGATCVCVVSRLASSRVVVACRVVLRRLASSRFVSLRLACRRRHSARVRPRPAAWDVGPVRAREVPAVVTPTAAAPRRTLPGSGWLALRMRRAFTRNLATPMRRARSWTQRTLATGPDLTHRHGSMYGVADMLRNILSSRRALRRCISGVSATATPYSAPVRKASARMARFPQKPSPASSNSTRSSSRSEVVAPLDPHELQSAPVGRAWLHRLGWDEAASARGPYGAPSNRG